MHKFLPCISIMTALLGAPGLATADADSTFHFESIKTLDEMAASIQDHFPLGSPRDQLRRTFVTEGRATLKMNPNDATIEKYIYDINLCSYYIWRWNISADYDAGGRLLQAYVNGNIVFPAGKPKKIISKEAEAGKKAAIYRAQRPRPEAYKGESSLGYIYFDRDSDPNTTDDQAAIGGGPTRADPIDMGKLLVYIDVDPWRSIFDADNADRIVPFAGDCAEADRRAQEAREHHGK